MKSAADLVSVLSKGATSEQMRALRDLAWILDDLQARVKALENLTAVGTSG
jgi:hypothetical protein